MKCSIICDVRCACNYSSYYHPRVSVLHTVVTFSTELVGRFPIIKEVREPILAAWDLTRSGFLLPLIPTSNRPINQIPRNE